MQAEFHGITLPCSLTGLMPGDINLSQVTLAVLGGGQGRRMGTAKANLRIGERSILEYLLKTLDWPGPTLLVTAPGREKPPGWELFSREAVDAVARGPLGGIVTALQNAETEHLLIVPVDMPCVGREQFRWMLNRLIQKPENIAAMGKRLLEGREEIEPFPLACRASARGTIEQELARGKGSVRALAEIAGVVVHSMPADWPAAVWTNLNTTEDYEAFVRNR
jgi:molybdenum cofactor guanylyltransferase